MSTSCSGNCHVSRCTRPRTNPTCPRHCSTPHYCAPVPFCSRLSMNLSVRKITDPLRFTESFSLYRRCRFDSRMMNTGAEPPRFPGSSHGVRPGSAVRKLQERSIAVSKSGQLIISALPLPPIEPFVFDVKWQCNIS